MPPANDTPPPQPTQGGSYVRLPDGSLQLLERTDDTPQPAAPDQPAEEPAP